MPDAPVLGGSKKVKLEGSAFAARFNEPLVHQSVRAEQAARRQGTAATKTRGMVSGGGAKPWKQKGTGRARAGSSRSPIWTGGGVVFGPQPRHYTFKVNRKEQRAALRSALSLHAGRGSIAILDTSAFSQPKTSDAFDLLEDWKQSQPTLVVLDAEESNAALSFRNIERVAVLTHENVGVTDLLGAASLLISQEALDALSARAVGTSRGQESTEAKTPSKTTAKKPAAKVSAAVEEKSAEVKASEDETKAGDTEAPEAEAKTSEDDA